MPRVDLAPPRVEFHAAEAIEALAWDPFARLLAAGDLAGGVAVLGAADLAVVQRLDPHPGGVTALAWHPAEPLLATGGVDGTVHLHHRSHGAVPIAVGGAVRALRWSPSGDLLAVGAGRGVWMLGVDGSLVASAPMLAGAVHDLAWMRDGPTPLAAAAHGGIEWIGPGTGSEPVETWDVTGAARVLATAPGHDRLASGDLAGTMRVTSPATRRELTMTGWDHRIERLAWCPSGHRLAVPDGDDVVVWHLDGVDPVDDEPQWFSGHDDEVTDVVYARSTLMSASRDGTVRRWPDDASSPTTFDLGGPVACLATCAGLVAAGTRDGRVAIVPGGGPDLR